MTATIDARRLASTNAVDNVAYASDGSKTLGIAVDPETRALYDAMRENARVNAAKQAQRRAANAALEVARAKLSAEHCGHTLHVFAARNDGHCVAASLSAAAFAGRISAKKLRRLMVYSAPLDDLRAAYPQSFAADASTNKLAMRRRLADTSVELDTDFAFCQLVRVRRILSRFDIGHRVCHATLGADNAVLMLNSSESQRRAPSGYVAYVVEVNVFGTDHAVALVPEPVDECAIYSTK